MLHGKRVSILGYAGTADECPCDTEIWGINQAGHYIQRDIRFCFAFDKLPPEYVKEMKAIAPVISWQPYADFKYPLKEIQKAFDSNYFVNTVCYMIAYAIFVNVEELGLYGCDTVLGATWQRESKGVEFWLGMAKARGMKLILPKKSGLLKSLQGRIFGKDGMEVMLSLSDRLALLRVLPSEGTYDEILNALTAKWILYPRKDEQKRYDITFGYDRDGIMRAVCSEKFLIDIPMSEEVWKYLRKYLDLYEQKGKLTSDMLSIYERLCTSEWREGEYGT